MSKGVERTIFYFDEKGPVNTEKTLEIALAHAREANIGTIVVAADGSATIIIDDAGLGKLMTVAA